MKEKIKCKDIPDKHILNYLWETQNVFNECWTCIWYGHFKETKPENRDIYYAMPEGTPEKLALAKMKSLIKRGLVDGCACGCRGDFEITDKGIESLNKD